jgi:hypothetical protein
MLADWDGTTTPRIAHLHQLVEGSARPVSVDIGGRQRGHAAAAGTRRDRHPGIRLE